MPWRSSAASSAATFAGLSTATMNPLLLPMRPHEDVDLRRADDRRGQQHPGHARLDHHRCLAQGRNRDADGAGRDLALGDLDALVGLGVGPQIEARRRQSLAMVSRLCSKSSRSRIRAGVASA